MPVNSPIELPAQLGKYELLQYLGGGMSHVYRANDTLLQRAVALKVLSDAGNKDRDLRTRFLEEARTASHINHENIIAVYDFGEQDGRPFMVMEFLRGESLRDAIKGGRTGDHDYKLSVALQVARALEYIHNHKIIHRDIKPENVHIDVAGKVKLMDFGIAKREGVSLTRAGFTLGTPYYMSPEQVMGQPPTNLVDVYAFGVMLAELFSGQKPISGDTVEKIFEQILHQPLNLDPLRAKGAPAGVINLIERCTAKTPATRPQGFGVITAEIDRLRNGANLPEPTPAVTPKPASNGVLSAMPRSQNWIMAYSAIGVVVLMLLVLAALRFLFPASQ